MDTNTTHPDRLLRLPDVISRVGLSKTTIYQFISEGKFPNGVHLSTRCTRWQESAIDRWIRYHTQRANPDSGNTMFA